MSKVFFTENSKIVWQTLWQKAFPTLVFTRQRARVERGRNENNDDTHLIYFLVSQLSGYQCTCLINSTKRPSSPKLPLCNKTWLFGFDSDLMYITVKPQGLYLHGNCVRCFYSMHKNKNILALPDTVPVIEDRVGLVLSQLPIFLLYQGICQRRSPQLEPLGCC